MIPLIHGERHTLPFDGEAFLPESFIHGAKTHLIRATRQKARRGGWAISLYTLLYPTQMLVAIKRHSSKLPGCGLSQILVVSNLKVRLFCSNDRGTAILLRASLPSEGASSSHFDVRYRAITCRPWKLAFREYLSFSGSRSYLVFTSDRFGLATTIMQNILRFIPFFLPTCEAIAKVPNGTTARRRGVITPIAISRT